MLDWCGAARWKGIELGVGRVAGVLGSRLTQLWSWRLLVLISA